MTTEAVTITPATHRGEMAAVAASQERVNELEAELSIARAERTVAVRKTLDAGVSQQAVADHLGVSRMSLYKWLK
jgi:transposase-like protein